MEDANLNSHSSPLDAIEERAEDALNNGGYWDCAGNLYNQNDLGTGGVPDNYY